MYTSISCPTKPIVRQFSHENYEDHAANPEWRVYSSVWMDKDHDNRCSRSDFNDGDFTLLWWTNPRCIHSDQISFGNNSILAFEQYSLEWFDAIKLDYTITSFDFPFEQWYVYEYSMYDSDIAHLVLTIRFNVNSSKRDFAFGRWCLHERPAWPGI